MAVALEIRDEGGGIRFDVKVVSRASRERIGPIVGDRIEVQVAGATRAALLGLLDP